MEKKKKNLLKYSKLSVSASSCRLNVIFSTVRHFVLPFLLLFYTVFLGHIIYSHIFSYYLKFRFWMRKMPTFSFNPYILIWIFDISFYFFPLNTLLSFLPSFLPLSFLPFSFLPPALSLFLPLFLSFLPSFPSYYQDLSLF